MKSDQVCVKLFLFPNSRQNLVYNFAEHLHKQQEQKP
jgi:hypothetical protein